MSISQKTNLPYLKTVNLGYKYRLFPNKEQKQALNHQMFIYNQAYNICLNLWQKEGKKNKLIENKKDKIYRKAVSYDKVVKRALRKRNIKYSTVVTQQARINFLKAVKKAFSKEVTAERLKAISKAKTPKEKAKAYKLGMPTFKSSKDPHRSFNWNNQGYQLLDYSNSKFKILRILKQNIKFRYHRSFPKDFKMCSITISKDSTGYYVSFGIEFKKDIGLVVSSNKIDITKSIGIDLNGYSIATSCDVSKLFQNKHNNQIKITLGHLLDNGAEDRKKIRYAKVTKMLERKQSKRVLKAKKAKLKLGSRHKKTQQKLNKKIKKLSNQKKDLYHKISKTLTDKFELIVVEDLNTKNMSKSSKGNEINHGKKVKQKSGLNRTILNASFYQFVEMLQYKQTMLNDKLFVKANPQYTSQTCNQCGNIDKNNRKTQSNFTCTKCNYQENADINASKNILDRGLKSFGLGTSLVDSKHKAFRSTSLEVAS